MAVTSIEVLILQKTLQLHLVRAPIGSLWDCDRTFLIGTLITSTTFVTAVR